jgi:hypothetical protein
LDGSARRRLHKARRQVPSLRRASWALMQEIGDRKWLEHGKGRKGNTTRDKLSDNNLPIFVIFL